MASSKVPSDKEEKALRLAIARQEDTLCALARDRDVAEHELRRLKSELESLEKEQSNVQPVAPHPDALVPATPSEKVDLFRSLFRGREDIYPKLWENAKTGRTGYAPRALTNGSEVFAKSRVYGVASARIKRFCRSPTALYWTISGDIELSASTHCCGTRHAGFSLPTLTSEPGRQTSWCSGMYAARSDYPSRSNTRVQETALMRGSSSTGP